MSDEYDEMLAGAKHIADTLDTLAALATLRDVDDLPDIFEPTEAQTEAARSALTTHDEDKATTYAAVILACEFLSDHGQDVDRLSADANDISEAAQEALNEYGLDFYETGEKRQGEWTSTGWVLVITTGGPHYELRDDGYVHGWGWFGSDAVQAPVSEDVTAYFESWTEG